MPRSRRAFKLDLYPLNGRSRLDRAVFRNPPAVYRGAPFWSWNAGVDREQLIRQIEQFREMGFGGFHIHPRTGMTVPYLGPEYLRAVAECTDHAAKIGMLSWLYDEDRWPSGFAGGLVTRDERHRARHLLWTMQPYGSGWVAPTTPEYIIGGRSENGTLLARYEIRLDRSGRLASYRRLASKDRPRKGADVWYAYEETSIPSRWFGGGTAVDVMSPAAIRSFIEITHERLAAVVGRHFGKAVPTIFTDEPQFPKKAQFGRSDETRDLVMPWTHDLPQTFRDAYGRDLLDHLPELFWDPPAGQASLARYRYHDHTAERFAQAFGDQIAAWCEDHGIGLTGHMLAEAHLHAQTRGTGESMRQMRSFQLPGIDILCDRIEYTTAKQAQSLARQNGCPGVASELYGVTGWHYDFVGHKAQGDWQAAMGVTLRVPHLAWQSMAGESKRDYPAAIGYQSPWWREYRLIEDHFARIATVMTRGRPRVRVAVIHPVESLWLHWGPQQTNADAIRQLEERFEGLTRWLVHGLIDFDFVCESILPRQSPGVRGRKLHVGACAYDAVVVPGLETVRSTTMDWLERFASGGGCVLFAGEAPSLVDARPSRRPARLAKRSVNVAFERDPILDALEPHRDLRITHADGSTADSLVHQLREDGRDRLLLLVNTDREKGRTGVRVDMPGRWQAEWMDTLAGTTSPIQTQTDAGRTTIPLDLTAHGHTLLRLSPARAKQTVAAKPAPRWREVARLDDPVEIELSEPNVLLLDLATWRINDGPWQACEEVLRIDNLARQALGLPRRGGRDPQPWTDSSPDPVAGILHLRFEFDTSIDLAQSALAIEQPEELTIMLDGTIVPSGASGWWVDESIRTVPLPAIARGRHVLDIRAPMRRGLNVEWCYLLGDFGVSVTGRHARLIEPMRQLAFGDWTRQGLPFYAGNVSYRCRLRADQRSLCVDCPKFRAPLLRAALDGRDLGPIAFAPFSVDVGTVERDSTLILTAFGNRANAFGPVHHSNERLSWIGPAAWRSSGAAWCYEYQLRPMGLLQAPIVMAREG